MFSFTTSAVSVSREVQDLFGRTWNWIADPGTWWTGPERTAIAEVAREHRRGTATAGAELPAAANEAAALLAATPAVTSQEWVEGIVESIGLERYIELTGVAAAVVAVDTVTGLLGCELEPLPEPVAGEPSQEASPSLNRGKAWVPMGRPPVPPTVLAAVPDTSHMINELHNVLYMSGEQMGDPDITLSGLHRTQIELVAATTSLGNNCFY